MVLKVLVVALLAAAVVKVFFASRWRGLGVWFNRFVDLALLSIALGLGINLLLIALR